MKPILKLTLACLLTAFVTSAQAQNAGVIDSSFGTNGRVYQSNLIYNLAVEQMAVLPDGKILVLYSENENNAFNTSYFTRFNADGSIDNTYGYGGGTYSLHDEEMHGTHFAVASNGRVAIIGERFINNDNDIELIVLDSNGLLDTSFSTDGKMLFSNSGIPQEKAGGVVIQPDGKIVLAQSYYSNSSTNHFGIMLQRLDGAGNYDFGYGIFGAIVYELPGRIISINNIFLKSNGMVQVVGGIDSTVYNGHDIFIAQFTNTGINTSFGTNGFIVDSSTHENQWQILSSAQKADESLLIGLARSSIFQGLFEARAFQFTPQGAPQHSLINQVPPYDFAEQADGNILSAGGNMTGTKRGWRVQRLTAGFTPDTTLGGFYGFIDSVDFASFAKSVAVLPDGNIMVAITTRRTSTSKSEIELVRLTGRASPLITMTCPSTAFSTTVGTPSATEIVTVNASNLHDNVTIMASAGFEVSTTASNFQSQIVLPQSVFTGGPAQFYVRFNPTQAGITAGTISANTSGYSGVLNLSGSTPTGISDPTIATTTLYPNPVYNELHIQSAVPVNEIVVTDVNGRTVLTEKGISTVESILPTADLTSGIYFCHIKTAKNTAVRRFIKQ